MTTARLYCSGLNFTYNPHRLLLNKVTDVYLVKDGQRVELQDDKLYRIVADLYSGQMLSAVTDMSYGILSIVPKYADGTPIEDFEDVILTENGKELKAGTPLRGTWHRLRTPTATASATCRTITAPCTTAKRWRTAAAFPRC